MKSGESREARGAPQLVLDSQKTVELRRTFPTAPRSGLQMSAPDSHGQIRDESVFGFARSVRNVAPVPVCVGQAHASECFSHRPNLIRLNQNAVGDCLIDAFLNEARIGAEDIITHQFDAVADATSQFGPPIPVILT